MKPGIRGRRRIGRLTLSILVPLVLLGILLNTLAVRFLVSPFRGYFSEQAERTLLHVSAMALAVCEDSFDELLRLRLAKDAAMVDTMRKDASERIKAIREEFLDVELVILEDGGGIVENTGVPGLEDPSALKPDRRPSGVGIRDLGGESWFVHSRYFPFWRWHVMGLVRVSDALAPHRALLRMSFLITFGTLGILLAGFLVGFYALVNRPLSRIREAARAVSAGAFPRIGLDRRDEIGEVIDAFNDMVKDLEKNRSEIEDSVREKEVLLREIHHRVKNNLAVVASLLNLQAASVDSVESALRGLEASRDRIFSMAKVHEQLCENESLSGIDMRDFLGSLVNGLAAVYAQDIPLDMDLDLADISLDITQAVPCGLVVNELVSNALIHGLRGRENPRLSVSLREEGGTVLLRVRDNGSGLPDGFDPALASSLGWNLVRILCEQLRGGFRREEGEGTSFEVSFPRGAEDSSVPRGH